MNLSGLLPALRALPQYPELLRRAGRDPLALGLPRAARLPIAAALAADLQRPILLIAARNDRALVFNEELPAWLPKQAPAFGLHHFAEPNPLPYEHAPWGPRTIRQRLAALAALSQPPAPGAGPPIVIASARALLARTLPRRDYAAAVRPLRRGQSIRLDRLLQSWSGAGYTGESIVAEPGQFSRRGGILDVWPPADTNPTRIELFGDEIEQLRRFDPATQRSGDAVESVVVGPAREALPRSGPRSASSLPAGLAQSELAPDLARLAAGAAFPTLEFFLPFLHQAPASLFDYLPAGGLILVDDWSELADTVSELESQALELRAGAVEAGLITSDFPFPHHSWSDLQDDLSRFAVIQLGRARDDILQASLLPMGDHFSPCPRFGGQIKQIFDYLGLQLTASGGRPIVLVTRQAARLAELWGEGQPYLAPVEDVPPLPTAGGGQVDGAPLTFVQGALAEGWSLDLGDRLASGVHLLTDAEIFGWARPEPRRRRLPATRADTPETSYGDFSPGDFVVHIDYGIGQFAGLVRRTIEGNEREYIHVQYDGGDDLYVPIIQADRLTRYIGADDAAPALSRLGTAEWGHTRARAQQAAEEVAREMLDLFARREMTPGRAFSPDSPWQRELEAAFPYIETEDQVTAIGAVKADMERPRPMDRLICGDVGYGKTEVALRAAFKAVHDGVQVAVLVPTTVLAQQHFNTFNQRLAAFPVRVEMLSRFRSPAEQKAILGQLASGQVDIVIGTHRLIQKDVQFQNLGLMIVDEEQRFGVTHKERLKQLRTEVDVLTLTATPIPRTLYLSLTGVRDISMIQTAPDERLPVVTRLGPYDDRLARQAILRELDRNGQVFFVHNRVQSIGLVQRRIETLVPEARLGLAHGQMDERQLAQAMTAFNGGEIDVLLCTSIIESGLDIPNANTLIVDRADTFGLAQLYQLRGRVGRGANRAYAYFFYDRRYRLTPEARQRLETIAEQTELGAGYGIAMRDLEMRGAGDILGVRQHGHIASVGFHLYTRLLAQAVRRLKVAQAGVAPGEALDGELSLTTVDLPIPAALPSDYIGNRNLRLKLYRRLAEIRDERGVDEMAAELADRFGPLPAEVESLLFQVQVKLLARRAGLEAVSAEDGQIVLRSRWWGGDEGRAAASRAAGPEARIGKEKMWLPRPPREWRQRLIETLAALAEAYSGLAAG